MIIVKLQGGLGNQMFQYAAARSIRKHSILDLSFLNQYTKSFEGFTARRYELGIFKNLRCNKIYISFLQLFLSKIMSSKLLKKMLLKKFIIITDDEFPLINAKKENYYLDGYFQDPLYFEKIRKELLYEFSFPKLPNSLVLIYDKIKTTKSVGIHVRRGDYLQPKINSYHGILPLKYYLDAISYINNSLKNAHYYIFSDDIDWCKEEFHFINEKTFISNENPAWIDMYLMSQCQHNITANSSFSWWAAWLNENIDKIVVSPKNWFTEEKTNIVCQEWISL